MLHGELPAAGALAEVGPATIATGGSVSNTGLALHKLGVTTRLVTSVGDDAFGRELQRLYDHTGVDASLAIRPGATSYTVVLSPPGDDRRFLHCPGTNAAFTDADVPDAAFDDARLLHFGYPPVMRAMCDDHGSPLVRLFERARRHGLLTSLDLCGVDPGGWAGRIDWDRLLRNVLPHVDVFLPSRDELRQMTDADDETVLALGCRVLVVKDGERGLAIRTAPEADSIVAGWGGRILRASTFEVEVIGTTGAGDTTIAGFLAGLVAGEPLDVAADLACAAGARCVGSADATSGLCTLAELRAFLAGNPPRRSASDDAAGA